MSKNSYFSKWSDPFWEASFEMSQDKIVEENYDYYDRGC